MNDNAPDFVCKACDSELTFGPAFNGDEKRGLTVPEQLVALESMGWKHHGDGWLCAKHKLEVV